MSLPSSSSSSFTLTTSTTGRSSTPLAQILFNNSSIVRRILSRWLLLGSISAFAYYLIKYFLFIARRPQLFYKDTEWNRNIIRNCPTFTSKYYPSFFFANAHLATFVCTYLRNLPAMNFIREKLTTKDGGNVYLDWVVLRPKSGITPKGMIEEPSEEEESGDNDQSNSKVDLEERRPTVVFFHGLNGGSDAKYVRHAIRVIARKLGVDQVRFVVMNNRGAGGTPLATPQGYCGAYTEDMRQAIAHIHARAPNSPIYAIGYSLGANLLLKYLGEEGEGAVVRGAISCSNPFDFGASSEMLAKRPLYNLVLTLGCVATVSKHAHIFRSVKHLDFEAVIKTRRLKDFDSLFTCKIFGYDHVDDYYNDASSINYLSRIRVPVLMVQATDDPIVSEHVLPKEHSQQNPNLIFLLSKRGGHVGFPEGLFPVGQADTWSDRVMADYLAILNSLNQPSDENQSSQN